MKDSFLKFQTCEELMPSQKPTWLWSFRPQLTLYAQKFDEFQETLSKSNEIYVRFKKEMDNVGGDHCVEPCWCDLALNMYVVL